MSRLFDGEKSTSEAVSADTSAKAIDKEKRTRLVKIIVTVVLLVIVFGFFMLSNVTIDFEKESFTASATLCGSTTVKYADITKVELRDTLDVGSRSFGMGSSKMSSGDYKNDEFGSYEIYSYKSAGQYIVIWYGDGEVVVFNGETEERTLELYSILQRFMGTK